jgi:hypothetical protein
MRRYLLPPLLATVWLLALPPGAGAGLEVTSLGRLEPPLPPRDEQRGTEAKWRRVQKDLGLDPARVVMRQSGANLGGNTSVRNRLHPPWKDKGYYQRCRDLGQVITVGEEPFVLDALILRTGNDDLAFLPGVAGAPLLVQFFEVGGTPTIDDNGTPPGSHATHGFSKNHRCDDVMRGVTYHPMGVATGGTMPDLRAGGGNGRLTYLKFDFTGEDELTLEAGKRYAFLVGIARPVREGNFTLANRNRASNPAPPRLTDPGAYPGGWGLRREGNGTRPRKVPGPNPPADASLRAELLAQSRFPPHERRLAIPPTTEGYPDVDTYRDLEFYVLRKP